MPRGKAKGSEFERKIAKEIIKAFRKRFKDLRQNDCWRSVLSGGHQMSAGDLEMSDRLLGLFPYTVECKFYKKVNWWHFLLVPGNKSYKKTWQEWKWVRQAVHAQRAKTVPILVVHGNNGPTMVVRPPRPEESGWCFELWSDFLGRAVKEARE